MNKNKPKISRIGESIYSLDWSFGIDPQQHSKLLQLADILGLTMQDKMSDLTIGYQSILIEFQNLVSVKDIERALNEIDLSTIKVGHPSRTRWHIPVLYATEENSDLFLLAGEKKIQPSELIELHASVSYRVYFMGFLPGFPYLGGLPEVLHAPRKETPELNIPNGSVGIGGQQTGIYPCNSPGGWHIIGKTSMVFFEAEKDPPVFIKNGDEIKFEPVSEKMFDLIEKECKSGTYRIKKQPIDD